MYPLNFCIQKRETYLFPQSLWFLYYFLPVLPGWRQKPLIEVFKCYFTLIDVENVIHSDQDEHILSRLFSIFFSLIPLETEILLISASVFHCDIICNHQFHIEHFDVHISSFNNLSAVYHLIPWPHLHPWKITVRKSI